jgi:isocitrate/isopropylmalate dehydrogenase
MKLGDGLFLNTCRKIAEEYKDSGIEFNDMIVDNTSVHLLPLSPSLSLSLPLSQKQHC